MSILRIPERACECVHLASVHIFNVLYKCTAYRIRIKIICFNCMADLTGPEECHADSSPSASGRHRRCIPGVVNAIWHIFKLMQLADQVAVVHVMAVHKKMAMSAGSQTYTDPASGYMVSNRPA